VSDRPLEGKIALVTGGSRGIGRAVAIRLAADGARVVVNYRQREDAAAETIAAIHAAGGDAVAAQANLASLDEIGVLFDLIDRRYGGLDILVSNAATGVQGNLADISSKAWEVTMNVNARAYLFCAQAALPRMKGRGGGRIVASTARIATERALPAYGIVAASKAAINALTVYLAVEFGPMNIRVNAVSPSVVDTEALHYYTAGPALLDRARDLTPTGRATSPEDVAGVVAFLCTDAASQINGQILEIDGGYRRLFL
jgi:enoyl-[acyl-carrier protein] reductase III